ncbi:SGNH/GDSL hydrolase family protein [Raoultella planticola]|uniref:SGNH/GDSL hydrolase family protein n=1 Tax=Raoultella planticola TaxID=575 RepID=UPI00223B23AC|nr:SGNH/GDSL hydrolase family protein [Raoultella planticola]MCS7489187.1 SGNH/GDSL hydrolase family protein [Raoultella planticola]MDC3906998.1 SGNH/GDSL hydrolase family protein [Raoultella planticola]
MGEYNTGNPVPSSAMPDAWDNNATIDEFVNSLELSVTTRTGNELDTLAGIQKKSDDQRVQIAEDGAAIVEETRQNLIPLSRQYMTLAAAQADIANIPVGSTTYVRSADGISLADEYINNAGTLTSTGRRMPSQYAMYAPNLISNSRASDSEKLPTLFSGSFSAGSWATAGSEMLALGAVQSVQCPPRSASTDPAVNYLFQQDISFATGGQYIAVSFLFRGPTSLILYNFLPSTVATTISTRTDDLGNGTYRATGIFKLTGTAPGVAQRIYFGCQQRGTSTTACEIAYPQMAVSDRPIIGVGGDMSLADGLNIAGVVAQNLVYNSYADPNFQLPRLRSGSLGWTVVSSITDATVAAALADAGAVSCLVAPPVTSSYVDALIEPVLDDTVFKGQWAAAEFYVYVAPGSGADPKQEIKKAAVFFIDVDNAVTPITPDVISRVSTNIFKVRADYQYTSKKPRRVSMGVRQSSLVSTFYVFGFFLAVAGQRIRDILQSPARDTGFNERVDGNARNIAFNPSGDPALQQQPVYSGSGAWTAIASLPTAVQTISQFGAKAAVPAPRIASGLRDALIQISLDGVKAGDYVRVEFSVYVNADAGVDIPGTLSKCQAFFWTTVANTVATTVKEKVTGNVYTMTAQYKFTADATRVIFGVRNNLPNVDFYVFNTNVASSLTPILSITKSLVRDPLLGPYIDSKISALPSNPYPPLLAVDTPITAAEDLILLPDQVFVHPTAPLILQCDQLLMNWTADMGQFLDWSIRGTSPGGQPYSYETNRTLEIDPVKTGTSVRISFHNRQKPAQWSSRDVTLVRGPAIVTASKNISHIGDSLGNRGQVARLTTLLTAAGVTVTQIGTMTQQEGGKGEGRESWAAAHFVGKRTLLNSTRINISSDNPSGTNKNPFLFEATEAQKTAHPEMCFLNTGAASEKSYVDTQTGVFYTFDYRKYLDEQGFADPDIVSIALAWNDQANGQSPDAYISQINYMVAQIRVACPNARIAIAPYCMTTQSRAVWNTTVSQYVRNVIGSFKGRQAEKLHIIPSWGIMPSDTAWSSDGSSITRDAMTGSYVDTHSDGIHWDLWGRQYMAYNCLFPFYIWACAQ